MARNRLETAIYHPGSSIRHLQSLRGRTNQAHGRSFVEVDIGKKDNSFGDYIQDDTLEHSQWQVSDYLQVNHPPFAYVPFDRQNISAAPGEMVQLRGVAARPGRTKISAVWWQQCRQTGTYRKAVRIIDPSCLDTAVRLPMDAVEGQTIHLILEATNDDTPPLTLYQRVVITCNQRCKFGRKVKLWWM